MKQLELFSVNICMDCEYFIKTESNYGWCIKKGYGSLDSAVYEKSFFCEMERRLLNNDLLTKRLKEEITHEEMYKKWDMT